VLGTYTIASNTLRVELSDDANQYVIADAIRVERVGSATASLSFEMISMDVSLDITQPSKQAQISGRPPQPATVVPATTPAPIAAGWSSSGLSRSSVLVDRPARDADRRATLDPDPQPSLLDEETLDTLAVDLALVIASDSDQ